MNRLDQIVANAPFRVIITNEDGSESSIACLSRATAERIVQQRRPKLGLPTHGGAPRSTAIEIREVA